MNNYYTELFESYISKEQVISDIINLAGNRNIKINFPNNDSEFPPNYIKILIDNGIINLSKTNNNMNIFEQLISILHTEYNIIKTTDNNTYNMLKDLFTDNCYMINFTNGSPNKFTSKELLAIGTNIMIILNKIIDTIIYGGIKEKDTVPNELVELLSQLVTNKKTNKLNNYSLRTGLLQGLNEIIYKLNKFSLSEQKYISMYSKDSLIFPQGESKNSKRKWYPTFTLSNCEQYDYTFNETTDTIYTENNYILTLNNDKPYTIPMSFNESYPYRLSLEYTMTQYEQILQNGKDISYKSTIKNDSVDVLNVKNISYLDITNKIDNTVFENTEMDEYYMENITINSQTESVKPLNYHIVNCLYLPVSEVYRENNATGFTYTNTKDYSVKHYGYKENVKNSAYNSLKPTSTFGIFTENGNSNMKMKTATAAWIQFDCSILCDSVYTNYVFTDDEHTWDVDINYNFSAYSLSSSKLDTVINDMKKVITDYEEYYITIDFLMSDAISKSNTLKKNTGCSEVYVGGNCSYASIEQMINNLQTIEDVAQYYPKAIWIPKWKEIFKKYGNNIKNMNKVGSNLFDDIKELFEYTYKNRKILLDTTIKEINAKATENNGFIGSEWKTTESHHGPWGSRGEGGTMRHFLNGCVFIEGDMSMARDWQNPNKKEYLGNYAGTMFSKYAYRFGSFRRYSTEKKNNNYNRCGCAMPLKNEIHINKYQDLKSIVVEDVDYNKDVFWYKPFDEWFTDENGKGDIRNKLPKSVGTANLNTPQRVMYDSFGCKWYPFNNSYLFQLYHILAHYHKSGIYCDCDMFPVRINLYYRKPSYIEGTYSTFKIPISRDDEEEDIISTFDTNELLTLFKLRKDIKVITSYTIDNWLNNIYVNGDKIITEMIKVINSNKDTINQLVLTHRFYRFYKNYINNKHSDWNLLGKTIYSMPILPLVLVVNNVGTIVNKTVLVNSSYSTSLERIGATNIVSNDDTYIGIMNKQLFNSFSPGMIIPIPKKNNVSMSMFDMSVSKGSNDIVSFDTTDVKTKIQELIENNIDFIGFVIDEWKDMMKSEVNLDELISMPIVSFDYTVSNNGIINITIDSTGNRKMYFFSSPNPGNYTIKNIFRQFEITEKTKIGNKTSSNAYMSIVDYDTVIEIPTVFSVNS